MNITGWFQSCENFKSELFQFATDHTLTVKRPSGQYHGCPLASTRDKKLCFCHRLQLFASPHQYSHADSCLDTYTELLLNHSTVNSTDQCMFFERNPYRRHVAQLTKLLSQKYGKIVFKQFINRCSHCTHSTLQRFGVSKIICSIYAFIVTCFVGRVNASAVGRILYALVLRKISTAHGLDVITRMMPFLLQSGCLGDNRALHLSSVLYSSGFGVRRQPYKVCVLGVMWQSGFSRISFTCLIVI